MGDADSLLCLLGQEEGIDGIFRKEFLETFGMRRAQLVGFREIDPKKIASERIVEGRASLLIDSSQLGNHRVSKDRTEISHKEETP